MLWDLHTDEGVAFDDIMEIVADADCDTWAASSFLPASARPWERLVASAAANYLSAEWAAAGSDNGVDH